MPATCNIMVVEDEALIALDLAMSLEEMGAEVLGPYGRVAAAMAACGSVDAAILDVDLCGETVFPLADRLRASGTPMLFHTARADTAALRDRYGPDIRILPKPARLDQMSRALVGLVGLAAGRHSRYGSRLRVAS